jgi:hypothetical protein
MADISELVVRLRALAAKFDKLSGYTGEYFHDIWSGVVLDANELVEEIYDAGFLLSIEKMDEVRNIIEASGPHRSLTKMFLFDVIVGFTLIPKSELIEEVVTDDNGDRYVMREYWFLEPGLLKQKSIHLEDRRTVELDDMHKRHGFELCDRCARGCEMLIEVIEREVAAHKPIQQADDGDGLFEENRILIWGGVRFELTTNQALIFALLVDAYPGSVVNNTFEDKGIASLRDSFRFNDPSGKKQYKPCWNLIEVGAVKDSKRLVDPSIVRADPEKFSSPQHNPQRSPG